MAAVGDDAGRAVFRLPTLAPIAYKRGIPWLRTPLASDVKRSRLDLRSIFKHYSRHAQPSIITQLRLSGLSLRETVRFMTVMMGFPEGWIRTG